MDSNQKPINIFGFQNNDSAKQIKAEESKPIPGESLDNCVRFGIKSSHNSQLVLYVIQVVRQQLHCSCYFLEDIFSAIPAEIFDLLQPASTYHLEADFNQQKAQIDSHCTGCLVEDNDSSAKLAEVIELKTLRNQVLTQNSQELLTIFKTNSFSYDFQLCSYFRQVQQQSAVAVRQTQPLNLSHTLHYFV